MDVLGAVADGKRKKTKIYFASNVNPSVLDKFLDLAIERGEVSTTQKKSMTEYDITPKGLLLVEGWKPYKEFINSIENDMK